MFKKAYFWIIAVLVMVAVVYAQQTYRSLVVMPSGDGGYVFIVQKANSGTIVLRVDTQNGLVAINEDLTVSDDVTISGDLAVTGISGLTGTVTLTGDLAVGGNVTGDVALSGGLLSVGSAVGATAVFTSTETTDTVLVTGALATDAYILSPGIAKGGSLDAQDTQLAYSARVGTLIAVRPASGLSALTYSWFRIR